jgi:hypothetical protein
VSLCNEFRLIAVANSNNMIFSSFTFCLQKCHVTFFHKLNMKVIMKKMSSIKFKYFVLLMYHVFLYHFRRSMEVSEEDAECSAIGLSINDLPTEVRNNLVDTLKTNF